MATVDIEKKTFMMDPDELLDIRKEALRAAVTLYQGKGDYLRNEWAIMNLARSFEEYLTRKVGKFT